jgi:hypothetical protein
VCAEVLEKHEASIFGVETLRLTNVKEKFFWNEVQAY